MRERWSASELARLRQMWEKYDGAAQGVELLSKELGRSPSGIRRKARSIGIARLADGKGYLNVAQIANHLGESSNNVVGWVRNGSFGKLLTYHKGSQGRYHLAIDALWGWMEDAASWHLWEPEKITDLSWCQHFTQIRQGWIRDHEAARIIGVNETTVNRLYNSGRLPGMRRSPRAVWFRREACEEYRLRQSGDVMQEIAFLRSEITRLWHELGKPGISAPNYPTRRYASQEANR